MNRDETAGIVLAVIMAAVAVVYTRAGIESGAWILGVSVVCGLLVGIRVVVRLSVRHRQRSAASGAAADESAESAEPADHVDPSNGPANNDGGGGG